MRSIGSIGPNRVQLFFLKGLTTDASGFAMGGILSQGKIGKDMSYMLHVV